MSLLKDIRLILTANCRETSHLVSDSLDRDLRWPERVAVRAHVLICRSCRGFKRQLLFLRDAVNKLEMPPLRGEFDDVQLSPEARERIRLALRSRDQT